MATLIPSYDQILSLKVKSRKGRVYIDVLDGIYDNLTLTIKSKHTIEYGTPSTILISLIEDLNYVLAKDIRERRGWYKK